MCTLYFNKSYKIKATIKRMVAVSNAETENLNKLSGSFVHLCQEFAN